MVFHKYLGRYGLSVLKDLELKVSVPSSFNDPFEFLPRSSGPWKESLTKKMIKDSKFKQELYLQQKNAGNVKNKKQFKQLLIKHRELFVNSLVEHFDSGNIWEMICKTKEFTDTIARVLCFSSETTSEIDQILLWSHYSENHSGMRFHFNTELAQDLGSTFEKVMYDDLRPVLNLQLDPESYKYRKMLAASMLRKSKAWEYENEYRLLVRSDRCQKKDDNLLFIKFAPENLIRIDLGLYCKKEKEVLSELREENKSHIRLFRASINPEEYKLDYTPINETNN